MKSNRHSPQQEWSLWWQNRLFPGTCSAFQWTDDMTFVGISWDQVFSIVTSLMCLSLLSLVFMWSPAEAPLTLWHSGRIAEARTSNSPSCVVTAVRGNTRLHRSSGTVTFLVPSIWNITGSPQTVSFGSLRLCRRKLLSSLAWSCSTLCC